MIKVLLRIVSAREGACRCREARLGAEPGASLNQTSLLADPDIVVGLEVGVSGETKNAQEELVLAKRNIGAVGANCTN